MRFAAFALLTLIAAPGWAAPTWDLGCDGDTSNDGSKTIQAAFNTTSPVAGRLGCLNFVNADSTFTSFPVQVSSTTAVACFDPDTAGTATDTSRVKIRWCIGATTIAEAPASNQSRTCIDMGGALTGTSTLDGTEGHAEVQNACLRIPPGVFMVEATAACTTDACSVRFIGEARQ
jgi:hypothetical protein